MKLFLLFLVSLSSYSQIKDTLYIKFDESNREMERFQFSVSEETSPSYSFKIQQKEETYPYDNKFHFSHYNSPSKLNIKFNGDAPSVFIKPRSFLEGKKVLNIHFFRTTPYIEVAKTFEKEDSWEQDVVIFIVDVDEMKNDSIVLREVKFTRPVKQ